MRLLLITILTLSLGTAADAEGRCRCKEAPINEKAEWSFETIRILQKKPVTRINGIVHDAAGAAMPNALVEIYAASREKDSKGRTNAGVESLQPRLAACKTDKDGSFCFLNTKAGKYIVSVTSGTGFCKTEIIVDLKVGNKGPKDKPLDVTLEVGK